VALVAASANLAADATAHLTQKASVFTRTRLTTSTPVLDFHVPPADTTASAAVEFSAAARTHLGGEVVLTVEPERWLTGPGGAADVDAAVTFAGDTAETLAGALLPQTSSVAGRWVGSGLRDGRLVFTLQTPAPGQYRLPLRLVLSAP